MYKSGKNVDEYKDYSTYTKITQGYVSYWDGTLYKKAKIILYFEGRYCYVKQVSIILEEYICYRR